MLRVREKPERHHLKSSVPSGSQNTCRYFVVRIRCCIRGTIGICCGNVDTDRRRLKVSYVVRPKNMRNIGMLNIKTENRMQLLRIKCGEHFIFQKPTDKLLTAFEDLALLLLYKQNWKCVVLKHGRVPVWSYVSIPSL